MRRKYIDQIAFWIGAATADGVGGNTLVDSLVANSWANVKTIPTNKLVQFGLDIEQTGIIVNCRTRTDINIHAAGTFIKYKSKEFTIVAITEVDLDGKEIEILATSG